MTIMTASTIRAFLLNLAAAAALALLLAAARLFLRTTADVPALSALTVLTAAALFFLRGEALALLLLSLFFSVLFSFTEI
jgi:hypothetical protein